MDKLSKQTFFFLSVMKPGWDRIRVRLRLIQVPGGFPEKLHDLFAGRLFGVWTERGGIHMKRVTLRRGCQRPPRLQLLQ